jgi:hypothetical protein
MGGLRIVVRMVWIEDRGSTFDAPIDFVWKYLEAGEGHNRAHKTTRNGKFGKVSEITFTYEAERNWRGKWAPDRMRLTVVGPVAIVTEWLEGALAGSKFVYLYAPEGDKTRVDVYGEFTSKTLPPGEVEAAAREFLDTEFEADAPVIREQYRKAKGSST